MSPRHRAASLLLALSLSTSAANAQDIRSKSSGFTIGGGLLGSSLSTTSNNTTVTESGPGLNVEAGWGFTPRLTVFLGINGSTIDGDTQYGLGQVDLGVRYLFRDTDKKARPYLDGALAARRISVDVTDGAQDLTIKDGERSRRALPGPRGDEHQCASRCAVLANDPVKNVRGHPR